MQTYWASDILIVDFLITGLTLYAEFCVISEPKPLMVIKEKEKFHIIKIPKEILGLSTVVLTQVQFDLKGN